MRTAAETLAVWETAGVEPERSRPSALLTAVGRDGGDDLPLGQRDAALLRLHAEAFGDRLDGLAHCPRCATPVELALSCAELLTVGAGPAPMPLSFNGYELTWRLPTARDLAALAGSRSADEAGAELLRRCVEVAVRDGAPVAVDDLPDGVRAAVGDAMAQADPLAEIVLSLDCPQCTHAWPSRLDAGAFVWSRLEAAASRLLREVDALARAYGWSEPQILALSETRRAAYIRMVTGG